MDESGWEIILGPPGTGKTTRLLGILRQFLSEGIPPDRIGFVTFTRRAATEAIDRVTSEFGLTRADCPWFRTLHSLCMRFGGFGSTGILQGEKMSEFGEWIKEKITGRHSVDGIWTGYARGDRMLFMDGVARIRRVPLRKVYEENHDDLDWDAVSRFSRGLENYKREHGLLDFTDLLERFIDRGVGPPLEALLVDEAQDLSNVQWDAVRILAKSCRRVVIAGDDDQAIFQWAGADVDTLIDLPGKVTVLDQSFRIPRSVQQIASELVGRIHRRRPKVWQPRDEDGLVRRIRRIDSLDVGETDTLILARNRHQLDGVASMLRSAGVLYEKEGESSVPPKLLRQIVTWERLRRGLSQPVTDVRDTYELLGVGSGVKRGHKRLPNFSDDQHVSMEDLVHNGGVLRTDVWHQALEKIPAELRSYLVRCRRNGAMLSKGSNIRLSTIHGSKGGEADRVVVMTDLAPRTWQEAQVNPDAEARVFYVAVTRAKKELIMVAPTTNRNYGV